MNGYSKIKLVGSQKSKYTDSSDLPSLPPQAPKQASKTSPKYDSKPQESKQNKLISNSKNTTFFNEDEDEKGERFGAILSRACSVSSSGSRRFRYENEGKTGVQSAVRRAFSMRRSSSVSERYSRIHDQSVTSPSFDNDENEEMDLNNEQRRIMKKKKNRSGKILKACKSLFRL